jgi:endonuclease/exonuclease/phosphatase (EEP) superfamily protein YafD
VLRVLVLVYGVAILLVWLWMLVFGDRRPLATLVLFGPRWVCALPWPALAVAAAVAYRRLLWVLAVIALLIVGPIMGFRVHASWSEQPYDLRILTCNVENDTFSKAALERVIDQLRPDIVALQEVRTRAQLVWPEGWHVIKRDEFVLASRYAIVERGRIGRPRNPYAIAALRFTVELPTGQLDVFNLHFESPRPGIEAVINGRTGIAFSQLPRLQAILDLRSTESQLVSNWVAETPDPKIVVGDFNMPTDSTIFRRDWRGYQDAFSARGWGFGFTKLSQKRGWSYGARIDHVLASPQLRCVRSFVADGIGSDHFPLAADYVLER